MKRPTMRAMMEWTCSVSGVVGVMLMDHTRDQREPAPGFPNSKKAGRDRPSGLLASCPFPALLTPLPTMPYGVPHPSKAR